jgi:arabinogalactan endo-1,4-beta-galactosidase
MTGGTKQPEKSGRPALSPRSAGFDPRGAFRISYFELLSNFDIRISNLALRTALLFLFLVTATASAQPVTTPSAFYLGGDISLESFMQQEGIHYRVGGAVAQNVDTIMYDHGANLFRIRIFVNPNSSYTNTGTGYPSLNPDYGAIQTTAYDIALAQQIRADTPGAKILLDFHYSDTWADPGKQYKPWQAAAPWSMDTTQAQLNSDVQTYTHDTLTAFYNAGVLPDMVQIGNETTNGILWQTGTIGQNGAAGVGGKLLYSGTQQTLSWQNFGGLLNSAIAGVRQVQSEHNLARIPVALSIDHGDKNGTPQYVYGNLQNPSLGNVTDFDIEGVDYYPSSGDVNISFTNLQSNLTTLANTNYSDNPTNPKKIMVLETNYPYTTHSGIGISMWPSTPAGQEAEFVAVRNLIMGLPHNNGLGVLYWNPEGVVDPNYSQGWYNGGTTALFDATSSHNAQQLITNNNFLAIGPGDFSADGHLTIADVSASMTALSDLAAYQSQQNFTAIDLANIGNLDGDLAISNLDPQAILIALANSSSGSGSLAPVPEPAAIHLFIIASTLLVLVRPRDLAVA